MATMDGNDPNVRGDTGDWWSQNPFPAVVAAPAPTPAAGQPGGPFATNPDGSQVGSGISWAAGASAPSSAPAGYHWDANFAMFVKDDAPVGNPNPDPIVTPPLTGNTGAVPFGVPTSGFGAAPAPYASNANAPVYTPMSTYVPPTWTGGDYVNPTEADLLASPGYAARLAAGQQARERSAAAQGTVLNGGTVKALDREAQNFATNEYQTLRSNTYDAYVQKYKQFTDAAGMDLNARTVNANENQNTFANRTAAYNTGNARTLSDYTTNVINKRNSELDYWNRLNDVNSTGAQLAGGSR